VPGRRATVAAALGRAREALLVWAVPAFPFLFLGLPLGGDRTVSLPKLVLLVTVVAWLVARGPGALAARVLRQPALAALAAYAALTLVGAVARGGAWYAAREALIALFVIGVWTSPPRAADAFRRRLTVVALLLSAWAVVLWARGEALTSPATRLVGTRTVAACFLVVVILSGIARRRAAGAAAATAGLLALRSVGAWLGLAAGVVTLCRHRGGRAVVAAIVYAAAILVVAANVPLRTTAPVDDDEGTGFWSTSVAPRLYGWRVVVPAIGDHPWLGHGLGTFPAVFSETEARSVPPDRRPWWRRGPDGRPAPGMPAHDDLLRIAVESGLPAAGLWALAMLLFVRALRGRRLARALLIAFLVETLTDNLYMLSNVTPVIFTAIALARDTDDDGERAAGRTRGAARAREGKELEPGAGVEPATY
jgi:O-antigen ligase